MPQSSSRGRRARRQAVPAGRGRRAGTRRAASARGRFPAAALVLASLVGLSGGVATAAVVVHPATTTSAPLAERDVTRTEEPGPTPSGTRSAAPVVPDGVTGAADRLVLSPEPPAALEPLPTPAPPATAAPVDPNAVDAAGLTVADREAGLLSTAVPTAASGDLAVVPGTEPSPAPERPVRTVRVEVEAGLEIDPVLFARTVMATLNDPRGWGADGSVSFARTDGPADLRVVLASPDLVDEMCAPLDTVGRYSCGTNGHAVLNHMRWVQGTPEFSDRTLYRQYLVNHEVGHLLGHRHVECPGPGQLAPLMQQQTVGVAPCVPNGWPFPG